MELKLLKSGQDYNEALKRFEEIFDAKEGTKKGDEAELLSILIEKYEAEHYPIEAPDPIEAIKFRMEQLHLKKKDLALLIGYRSRVSEILSKKRKLNLNMIRILHEKLNIPYESLMKAY